MTTIESLGYTSISDMPRLEAYELIKSIRLSRRVPLKKPKRKTTATSRARKVSKDVSKSIDSKLALELLKMIGE